jgi:HlyD family secretion protein
MGGALGLWVLIYPETPGLLDARAGGQVRRLRVAVGQEVRQRQTLMELYLPVLDRQLQQQRGNLAQLERDNRDLDRRDALRLSSERLSVDTALAKLVQDRRRYEELAATYAEKVRNLRWLTRYEQVKLDIQTQALRRR